MRRQNDQVKGHELHGVLPVKKVKVASLSQSYFSAKVLILEMKSQSLLDCNSELKSDHVLDSFSFHLYETSAPKSVSQMQESSGKPACRSKQTSKNMPCLCLLAACFLVLA